MTTTADHFIDLHIHSNCSDGAFSAQELVEQASALGLQTIAIADHDSVAGIVAGMAVAERLGVELLPAVELSVQYDSWSDVHLLGYGIDYADRGFIDKLNDFRQRRETRNGEILARVNDALAFEGRCPVETEEVLRFARDVIGRPHIARALLERGYVNSIEEAFRRYLVPCNVPKFYWPIDEALTEIRRLGGVSVLAHPTSVSTDRQQLRRIVTALAERGLDGVEVYNNLAQENEMEFLWRRTLEAGLLVTGGSDYHGIEAGVEMGRGRGGIRFSASLLTPLRKRLSERQPCDTHNSCHTTLL
jgi:3',5'-nucleoside bisphosphate phosphatase